MSASGTSATSTSQSPASLQKKHQHSAISVIMHGRVLEHKGRSHSRRLIAYRCCRTIAKLEMKMPSLCYERAICPSWGATSSTGSASFSDTLDSLLSVRGVPELSVLGPYTKIAKCGYQPPAGQTENKQRLRHVAYATKQWA